MYTRSPTSSGTRGVRIPRNYSGNAFSAPQPPPPQEDPSPTEIEETAAVSSPDPDSTHVAEDRSIPTPKEAPVAKLFPSLGFHSGKLLGSFGTEELLILGLIFLLRGNEGGDDLLLLLVLLLLIQ